ncbi:hypothetical protein [Bartonella sp. CL46QHWL]
MAWNVERRLGCGDEEVGVLMGEERGGGVKSLMKGGGVGMKRWGC